MQGCLFGGYMRKEEFYFDSRDGISKLHAVRYLPETEPVAVLQIVHGMAEHVGRYEELAQFLTERGFLVTAEDHLGHGASVAPGKPYGYFCKQDPATVVVRDVHRLKKMTQEKFPGLPYVILGHSMGSFILRNYLCRYGSGIQGAVIVGTGMQPGTILALGKALADIQKVFLGDKHVSRMLNRMAFGSYNKRIPDAHTESDWLSRNTENVTRYREDPMCGFGFTVNGFRTLFELISRMQKEENLEKIPKELPVFLVSGEEDPVGAYGRGVVYVFRALERIGLQRIQYKLYPEDRHEILNESDRQQVMQDIYEWICREVLKK